MESDRNSGKWRVIEAVISGEWRVISKSKRAIKNTHLQLSVIGMMLSLGIPGAVGVDADDEQAARAYDEGLRTAFRQEHQQALTALHRAIKLDSSLADAHYYLGILYGARDGWNKALAAFQNATAADPAYIEAYCRIGETYLVELARVNEAVEPLERAVQMDPHHAQARSLLGTAYFRQNRLEEAIRELQHAVELDPSSTDALYTLGLGRFRSGENEAASLHFKKIIELDPFYAKAYLNLGNCYRRMGQADNSRKALETFARLSNDEEQIARLERAVRHGDSDVEAWYQLGRLQMARRQWETAAGAFKKCITLRPNEARGYDALGYLYFQLKAYRKALQIYEDVVKRHPDVSQYRNSLGTVYMTIGNYPKAIEQLESAVQLSPSEPAFHLTLAQTYKRAGYTAKAEEAFHTYQQLKSQKDEQSGK